MGEQIGRMMLEACAAHPHGLPGIAGAPVFVRKVGKRNRRRILPDPASKFVNAWSVRHVATVIAKELGLRL